MVFSGRIHHRVTEGTEKTNSVIPLYLLCALCDSVVKNVVCYLPILARISLSRITLYSLPASLISLPA